MEAKTAEYLFQSLIGRLQTRDVHVLALDELEFQSLIGRLQTHERPSNLPLAY